MAMDLRCRNKQHVMGTMEGKIPAPRAHEFAFAQATFTTGWITSLKVVTRPRDVLMGHNPRNQWLWRGVEFVSGVYPGRRFRRLTGRRLTFRCAELVSADRAHALQDRERNRIIAVFSMPSFIAIASALLKPMPRISRASR